MIYHIAVTQADIEKGQCSSAHQCPIARAATRIIFGREVDDEAIISPDRVAVTNEIKVYYGKGHLFMERGFLPQEARDFVNRFDSRLSVEPFEFDVEVA